MTQDMTQAGDLNQDGRLDGKDIALLKSLLQAEPKLMAGLSQQELHLLDVNHDGQINQDDLTALYSRLLSLSGQLSSDSQDKLNRLRHKLNP